MKGINNVILFVIIFLVFFIEIPLMLATEQKSQYEKHRYHRIVKLASRDAVNVLAQPVDCNGIEEISEGNSKQYLNRRTELNLDKALDKFYETLKYNLRIENDLLAQKALNMYVPLKLVVMYDGYYINTWQNINGKLKEIWLPKKAFEYFDKDKKLLINFTLTDDLFVMDYNSTSKNWSKQSLKQVSSVNKKNYESIKKRVIADKIRNDLQYCVNQNNELAKRYGVNTYIYNLPEIDDNVFSRNSIQDVSFLAFVQGMPIKYSTSTFNEFGYSATKLNYVKKYYGTSKGELIYHKEGCGELYSNNKKTCHIDKVFNNQVQAVKEKYYPCKKCILNQN